MRSLPPRIRLAALAAVLALFASSPIAAQEAISAAASEETTEFFRRQCARCHTIGGGRLTGPDLANVHQRRDREWLVRFLLDPQAMIDAGDPYALEMLESARGVVMPQVAGMDDARARALLDLIERESVLEDSEFSTPALPADPFTDSDRMIGRMLFTGKAPLRSGAPPCSGCHDLAGLEGWGGGRLAPDLSRVYERFGSRAAVSEWLQDPAATSHPSSGSGSDSESESDAAPPAIPAHRGMESSEVHPLSAALEEAARHGPAAAAPHQLVFSAAGWGAASLVLALVGLVLWRLPKDHIEDPDAAPRWAGPALGLGMGGVGVLHLLPLLAADAVAGWLRKPETLQALETAHLAAGLLVLLGLVGRYRRRGLEARPSLADRAFVATFALAVVSGLLAALFHRWGLAWLAGWIAPSLGDLLRGEGNAGALMDALPLLVRLHVASGALALVLLPFSRWRSLLDPRRLDPRRLDPRGVEWRRLDPRRLLPKRRTAARRTAKRRTAQRRSAASRTAEDPS